MTDIEKFDRAVYQYLTSISDKIVYAPTQSAIKTITKREKFSDNKPWNFISYYRDSQFDVDWNRMNNPATISGDRIRLGGLPGSDLLKAEYVQNIPLNLSYDVNIWASKNTEVLDLSVALISKLYMQEQVIKVPINPDGELGRFHLLDITWSDNSDIERETEIGKIYRHTISFTIDARLTLKRDVKIDRFQEVPVDIYED